MPTASYSSPQQTPTAASGVRGWIERLGPYQSLFLLLIPISLVEPMKLIALAVAGKGHWITGTGLIVIAYAGSLLIVETLFKLVKPRSLKLHWFARVWTLFVVVRTKTLSWFARFMPFLRSFSQSK